MKKIFFGLFIVALFSIETMQAYYKRPRSDAQSSIYTTITEEIENLFDY